MRIAPVLLTAALSVGLRAQAAPDPLAQPKTETGVLATEAAWVETLKRRDTATLRRLLAEDFIDTTWQGQRRAKPLVLSALAANGPQPLDLSDMTVALHGDTAVARGLNTIHGPDGAVRARIRFTDVFVYRAGGWRALAAQETLEQPAAGS